ncbi:hypothetical protein [Cellulomonas sp. Marseille-Q8402]
MNRDLDSALRDLASGAAAAHRTRVDAEAGLLLDPTVRRVRRRRVVRGALATTGTAAVLTGLVLGGLALGREPAPQPAGPTPSPSVSTPDPTPTPTPSVTPAPPPAALGPVLPTGDPALPFGACGSLAGAAPATPVDPAFLTEIEVGSPDVPAGGSLEVRGLVHRPSDPATATYYTAVPSSGPRLAVLRDGVVVGTGLLGGDASWELRNGYLGEARWSADWLPLAVCGPDGQPGVSAGAPLPAGAYQVVPWADVVDLGTSDEGLVTDGGDLVDGAQAVDGRGTRVTALGAPVDFTVSGTADTVAAPPGSGGTPTIPAGGAGPLCTGAAPAGASTGPLRLDNPFTGGVVSPGDLADLTTDLTYTGEGRLGFRAVPLWVLVTQGGLVVGSSPYPYEADWRPLLATGTAAPLTPLSGELTTCDTGEPLPAGTYELWLSVQVLPDGTPPDADGTWTWSTVVSEPATLVVP